MLKRIKLENFKSWKQLDIELAPLTLLFGTNSSGKTSILQSLLLLKQTANSLDPQEHINLGSDKDYINLGSYSDLIYSHVSQLTLGIDLRWNSHSPQYNSSETEDYVEPKWGVNYSIGWAEINDRVAIERLKYATTWSSNHSIIDSPTITAFRVPNNDFEYDYEVSEPWFVLPDVSDFPPQSCYIIPYSVRPQYLVPYQAENGEKSSIPIHFDVSGYSIAFKSLIDRITYLGPLREAPAWSYQWQGSQSQTIGPKGENTVTALIASARGSQAHAGLLSHVTSWLQQLELASELNVRAIGEEKRFYEAIVAVGSEHMLTSLTAVGFGISQVLPVLTLLFLAPRGSIVLIEQPELHLHPSAQAHLADLFLEVAETRNLQLIVESHSEHLLRRIQRRIAEREQTFATPENIKAYFCEPGSDGSTIREVEVDEYGQIRNWPENFFGDLAGDLDAMMSAALERRRQELSEGG